MRRLISMYAFVRSLYLLCTIGLLALWTGGCDVPAQIVWSPDGTQAAYRAGNTAFLLNEQGFVLQSLGDSVGGFAWAADSKSLYFATTDDDLNNATPLDTSWRGPADVPSTQPATQSLAHKSMSQVSVLANGRTQTLFRLADLVVWHMALSPDGRWLAVMATVNHEDTNSTQFELLAYSLAQKKLYELSQFCGLGLAFTGPSELAFVEATGTDAVGQINGHIVKVKLDPSAVMLPRQNLLDVIVPLTKWLKPCKGGLMFVSSPRAFPAPPQPDLSHPIYKLFHLSCADGGLTVLADDVGELFDTSPDGKRILYEKYIFPEASSTAPASGQSASAPEPQHDDLCVMNANGSNSHVLRALDSYVGDPKPPMWPAWHDNDQITWIAKAEDAQTSTVDDKERKVVDVIEYHLDDKGGLEPLQSLSGEWKPEIKPYFHHGDAKQSP